MTDRLTDLIPTLDSFAQGQISVGDFARQWRDASQQHEPALPERYLDVLERVLNQLESSALFTEESCSFSHGELMVALGDWLIKARSLQAN